MQKSIIRIILSCCVIIFSIAAFAVEPENFYDFRNKLIQYNDSGNYEKDLQISADKAKNILSNAIHNNKTHKKLAITFDIDETALSNIEYIKATYDITGWAGTGFPPNKLKILTTTGNSPAIKPILKLYKYAINHNVSVFFITARSENNRIFTDKNLKQAGYKKFSGLYLKPENWKKPSSNYKSAIRAQIEKAGYDIVLNIGDQYSDLIGGYADHGIKLVNPFCKSPEVIPDKLKKGFE